MFSDQTAGVASVIRKRSRSLVDPEWMAALDVNVDGVRVKTMVCGKTPKNTQDVIMVYVVNHPKYHGRVDSLSLNEYTALAISKELTLDRDNGSVSYTEFKLISNN